MSHITRRLHISAFQPWTFALPSRCPIRTSRSARFLRHRPPRAQHTCQTFAHVHAYTESMASIRTSVPFPTQPWEAAKRRFLEGLSLGERDRFQNATAENVFYDASASQKKHAQGSKSWLVHEKLSSLTDGIEDYGKALDVFSNTYGLILCPLWGSVRVVLQVSLYIDSEFYGQVIQEAQWFSRLL
jgi:hypothetical protein